MKIKAFLADLVRFIIRRNNMLERPWLCNSIAKGHQFAATRGLHCKSYIITGSLQTSVSNEFISVTNEVITNRIFSFNPRSYLDIFKSFKTAQNLRKNGLEYNFDLGEHSLIWHFHEGKFVSYVGVENIQKDK